MRRAPRLGRREESEREVGQVWWRILGSAVAFESDAAMSDHKAAHGRTHAMAAPLDAGGRVWRAERGEISQAGQTAIK